MSDYLQAHPAEVSHVYKIAQVRCEDNGISVRFDVNAETAYTDGGSIVLPGIKQPITKKDLDIVYGMTIHETGHILRKDAFKILKKAKPPQHLAALFNITEDDGMERERALDYAGDGKALSIANDLIVRDVTSKWADAGWTDEQDPAPLACLALNQLSRLDYDTVSTVAAQLYIKSLPDNAKRLLDELEQEGWVHKLRATKTPYDCWDLAVDLAKRLYPENDMDEYEEIREAGKGEGDGERDDSNSSFNDAQSKQGQADGEDGESEASSVSAEDQDGEGTGEDGQTEGTTVDWKDVVLSDHTSDERGTVGITYDNLTGDRSKVMLAPPHLIDVKDLKHEVAEHRWGQYTWRPYLPTDEDSKAFANKIRRYIQAMARSTVEKEKRSGLIDRGELHRLAMPPIDGGEWNKKIFYTQRKHVMKDTCIFVLSDWSGSMIGRKMRMCADASQRLVWCFDRVLHCPVALAAFSDRYSFCDIGYIKKFHDRGVSQEDIARRFGKFYDYTSGNNDADALNWAYHEILRRKEQRKILIVISDGAPTGYWSGGGGGGSYYCRSNSNPHDNLVYITDAIDKDKRVDLYGLGVCNHSVKNYYKNAQVIHEPEQITEALFNMIKDGNNGRY